MFGRKRKQIVPPPVAQKVNPKTKKAVDFFNGKKSAVDLIELEKGGFQHSGYTRTLADKFYEIIEGKDLWQSLALIATMVFVISIALWGISQ